MVAKRYSGNRFYSWRAERDFVRNTTATDVAYTLAVQAFWDRIFRIDWIAQWLATALKDERRATVPRDPDPFVQTLEWGGCGLECRTSIGRDRFGRDVVRAEIDVRRGRLANAALGLGFRIEGWDAENFLCAPGASYNAGRFARFRSIYPPFLPRDRWSSELPILTSEIPGLDLERPCSGMDLRIGEITSPMLGIWFKGASKSLWIETRQRSALGENGFAIRENRPERRLTVELMSPIVRERVRAHGASTLPSWDRGRDLVAGDRLVLEVTTDLRDCASIEEFYAGFREMQSRKFAGPTLAANSFPLSAARDRIESQYNERKWSAEFGYYHAGFLPPFIPAEAWSAGWTGGLALSYAFLADGREVSRERALENLAFFFRDGGQSPSGIFYATSDGNRWGGDDYFVTDSIGHRDCLHVRRCGDYLYFLIKHFRLLEARGESERIDATWLSKTQLCADALCRVWRTNRHFGQYIDPETLRIRIGNSDAGGMVPAALAACAGYFGRPEYLDVAVAALTVYHDDYLAKGFTAGGPLEILCAPDCESAFNLLESMMAVYEQTNDPEWLAKAHRYADYVRTWFYSYDVEFPAGSTYGRLGVRTTGAMMASSQNRCAVPNICTLSGDALWKLYRYTGDDSLLRILQACVHNTQQYVSREDRPIPTMRGAALKPGTIHECIQTGDWSGPTGEIPYEYPTSWSEVAHVLAIAEIPGIYWVVDRGRPIVFDHLDVDVIESSAEGPALEIRNPTPFTCRTRLYVETTSEMQQPLPFDIGSASVAVTIEPGRAVRWRRKSGQA